MRTKRSIAMLKGCFIGVFVMLTVLTGCFQGGIEEPERREQTREQYVGACYEYIRSAALIMTQQRCDSNGIQMILTGGHWGWLDHLPDSAIINVIDSLYPNDAKLWWRQREWHPVKMRKKDVPYYYGAGMHQGPALPEYRDDWYDYNARIVKLLGKRIAVYQVGNEPGNIRHIEKGDTFRQWLGTPDEFAENAIIAYKAVREVNPDILIAAPGDGFGVMRDSFGTECVMKVLDYVDLLDFHYYGEIWEDRVAWDSYLTGIDKFCKLHDIRWAITELNMPILGLPAEFWPVFDSLRSVECWSHEAISSVLFDSLRKVDPQSLHLPENYPKRAEICYQHADVLIEDFLEHGAYFVGWFGFEHSRGPGWFKPKCVEPNRLKHDAQSFWHTLNNHSKRIYQYDPEKGKWQRMPVGRVIKRISQQLRR